MKVCEGLLRKAFARCLQPHALNGMAGLQDAVDQKRRLVTGKIEKCRDECITLVDNQTTLEDSQGDEQKNNAKRQKLERQLANITKAEAAAKRNAHFGPFVIPDIKKECMLVPLLHLQAGGDGHQRPKAFLEKKLASPGQPPKLLH